MATTTAHAPAAVSDRKLARPAAERSVWPDPGPWLYMAAPVSFAITLAVIMFLSRTSF
jgi:hypothetical protein